jgi:hypothetical protein
MKHPLKLGKIQGKFESGEKVMKSGILIVWPLHLKVEEFLLWFGLVWFTTNFGPLVILPSGRLNGEKYVELILDGPLWDFYSEIQEERGLALLMENGSHQFTHAIWQKNGEI